MSNPGNPNTFEFWITDRALFFIAKPKSGSTGTFELWITDRQIFNIYVLAEATGALTQTLTGLALSASGKVGIAGTLTKTLTGLVLSTSGKVGIAGTLTKTLTGLVLSASGTAPAAHGVLDITLLSLSLSSTGYVWYPYTVTITGEADQSELYTAFVHFTKIYTVENMGRKESEVRIG